MKTLPLASVPLSRRGNWLSLFEPELEEYQPLGPGLYLRSNHARGIVVRELFKIELEGGTDSIEADYTECRLQGPKGKAVIAFTPGNGVRFLAEGCGLKLSAVPGENSIAYSPAEGEWVFNLRQSIRRYHAEALQGSLKVTQNPSATDTNFQAGDMLLEVLPNEQGICELAIDEFWSGWIPVSRPAYEAIQAELQSDFQTFHAAMPKVSEEWSEAAELASYVLWSCTMSPCGQLKRETVFMALGWMDQIWSWDNLFNLCSLAAAHPDLAADQLRVEADHQDEHGAYPDGMNDMFKHYNFGKPPVHGMLFRHWLAKKVPGFWTLERQAEFYKTLSRFADFWLNQRLDRETGLPYYIHGNESQDNSTLFDQGSPLITPDLASYLITHVENLAEMAEALNKPGDAARWIQAADELTERLLSHSWNGGRFEAIKVDTRERVWSKSILPFKPLLLGERLPDDIRAILLKELPGWMTTYGVATEHPESPKYESDSYWRGPIWAPTTMLLTLGLRRCNENELADQLARNFCNTCAQSGFAENFDALTGAPLRDNGYTWTAAVFFCLAGDLSE